MSSNLPLTVQTPADIQEAADYLRRFLAAHRSKQPAPEADAVAPETRLWAVDFVTDQTVAGIEAGLKALLTYGAAMPLLEIQTAAPLSPALQRQVVGWLRQEVNPQILIRTTVRRSLVGGMVVRSSRRQYDLSVAHAFDGSRVVLTELVHAWA